MMQREKSSEWQQFTDRLTSAIKDLSLLYAHSPDDKARASLQSYVDKILPELTKAVGARMAARILEIFTAAVIGRKNEIESGGVSRA
jgi:hypothetical protein